MIQDCARCGDPLVGNVPRCQKCGTDNPTFQSSEPENLWSSDLGIEAGMFAAGVYGLLLGVGGVLSYAAPPLLRVTAGACGVLGLGSMLAYHRVHAVDLGLAAKWALRIAVFAALVLFGLIHHAIRRS